MDYFNPASFQPKYNWTPGPIESAGLYTQDRGNYNNLMQMFQSGQATDLAKKQAEFEAYQQAAPVRSATNLADIAKAQASQQTAIPMAQANLNKLSMENQKTQETMSSDIAASIAKNLKGKSDDEIAQIINDLKRATVMQGLAEQAPGYQGTGQIPMSVLPKIDATHPMDKLIMNYPMQQGGPQKILRDIAQIDPKYIQEMAKQNLANEGALATAREHSRGSIAVANIYDKTRRDNLQRQNDLKRELASTETEIKNLAKLYSEGKLSENQVRYLSFLQQQAIAMRQAQAGAAIRYGDTVAGGLAPGAIPTPPDINSLAPSQSRLPSVVTKEDVEAIGWPYEPDKYDYRRNPLNGKLQRALKGQ